MTAAERLHAATVDVERMIAETVTVSERVARDAGRPVMRRSPAAFSVAAILLPLIRGSETIVGSMQAGHPRVLEVPSSVDNLGVFIVEPLDPGFGYAFGRSLRRVLLGSLAGAAVTRLRVAGVAGGASTIDGVAEDVTAIGENFARFACRIDSSASEVEASLIVTGPKDIRARDVSVPAGVVVLNPDLHIATLKNMVTLELYLTIGRGRGHRPAEASRSPGDPAGIIPIAARFSPVRRVTCDVESARAGGGAGYDRLTLLVETDGSIAPRAALREAAEMYISQLMLFTGGGDRVDDAPIEDLGLGDAWNDRLKRVGIRTMADLVERSRAELGAISIAGPMSVEEVVEALRRRGLELRE